MFHALLCIGAVDVCFYCPGCGRDSAAAAVYGLGSVCCSFAVGNLNCCKQ